MSPGSGLISPGGDEGSSDLVILQYRARHWLGNVFRHHRRERARVLALSVRPGLLQSAEEVVVLVCGEIVLRLVPVSGGARPVVGAPGHVREQGLGLGKPLPAPDTSVEVD